jgi:outer membrane murein-binding lipoprotein Lpp
MNTALEVFAALASLTVFCGGIAAIVRVGYKQTSATQENTSALRELKAGIDKLDTRVNAHDVSIGILQDRMSNGRHRA